MAKKLIAAILILLISQGAGGAGTGHKYLLQDGFVMFGVDGKLTNEAERWFFELESSVSDDKGQVGAGTKLELLPSSALEGICNTVKGLTSSYRIWGRVTKYRDRNFIFGIYFLPLSEAELSKTSSSQAERPSINEPNDALPIPEEIIAKLKTKKIIHPEELKKGVELKADSILADRTGFIVEQGGRAAFVLDGLGQNVGKISFPLLACEALEHAQRQQSIEPEAPRFKVAGIVTKYKGEYYLLLQRAMRAYNYGNFR